MKINILKDEKLKNRIIKEFQGQNTVGDYLSTKKPIAFLGSSHIAKGNEFFENQREKVAGNYVSLSRYAAQSTVKENTNSNIGVSGLIDIGNAVESNFVLVEKKAENYISLKEHHQQNGKSCNVAGFGGIMPYIKEMDHQVKLGNLKPEQYDDMISIIGFNLLMGNSDFQSENMGFTRDKNKNINGVVIIDSEPKYAMGDYERLFEINTPANLTVDNIKEAGLSGLAEIYENRPELWDGAVDLYKKYTEKLDKIFELSPRIPYNIRNELAPKRISDSIEFSHSLEELDEASREFLKDFFKEDNPEVPKGQKKPKP